MKKWYNMIRIGGTGTLIAAMLCTMGCGDADRAADNTGEALEEAGDATKDAVENVGDEIQDAADEVDHEM